MHICSKCGVAYSMKQMDVCPHDCRMCGRPWSDVRITRFEVIDQREEAISPGRRITEHDVHLSLSYQDEGRTLKVFLTDPDPAS